MGCSLCCASKRRLDILIQARIKQMELKIKQMEYMFQQRCIGELEKQTTNALNQFQIDMENAKKRLSISLQDPSYIRGICTGKGKIHENLKCEEPHHFECRGLLVFTKPGKVRVIVTVNYQGKKVEHYYKASCISSMAVEYTAVLFIPAFAEFSIYSLPEGTQSTHEKPALKSIVFYEL